MTDRCKSNQTSYPMLLKCSKHAKAFSPFVTYASAHNRLDRDHKANSMGGTYRIIKKYFTIIGFIHILFQAHAGFGVHSPPFGPGLALCSLLEPRQNFGERGSSMCCPAEAPSDEQRIEYIISSIFRLVMVRPCRGGRVATRQIAWCSVLKAGPLSHLTLCCKERCHLKHF
jgi:hypothetical protein